jgi:hypothetical protein
MLINFDWVEEKALLTLRGIAVGSEASTEIKGKPINLFLTAVLGKVKNEETSYLEIRIDGRSFYFEHITQCEAEDVLQYVITFRELGNGPEKQIALIGEYASLYHCSCTIIYDSKISPNKAELITREIRKI